MTAVTPLANAPDLSTDNYLVLGLATCFIKEEGEVHQVQVIEPIPSASLEALLKSVPTSYSVACGTTLGKVISGDSLFKPAEFPEDAQFCDDFTNRAFAAARTYKSCPEAIAHIPLGTTFDNFNFSTERKRLLNMQRVVTKEDNVKQHEYTHKLL
ncbi:MAG: hypothetical protein F6K65_07825 [Moorea sp. SIO3C2]|nr:hypothetical protein [Moorena sp. SIO3C2]